MAPPHFLTLPREVRDMIYQYYLYEPEGFHYGHKRRNFRTSRAAPIDISLKYVCKQTHSEIGDTALTFNVLHFTPAYDEITSYRAKKFAILLENIEFAEEHAIKSLTFPKFSVYRTSSVDNVVDCMYPDLRSLFQFDYQTPEYNCCLEYCKLDSGMDHSLGEAPSLLRSYTDTMIYALSKNSDFVRAIAEWAPPGREVYGPRRTGPGWRHLPQEARDDQRVWSFFNHNPQLLSVFNRDSQSSSTREPWSIPSEDDMEYLRPFEVGRRSPTFLDGCEGGFSAAAVAIACLKALKQEERLAVRRIVLYESHTAFAHPECHGLGLIPFCQENPLLRVSRHVDVWETALSPVGWDFFGDRQYVKPDQFPNNRFRRIVDWQIQTRAPGQIEDWEDFEKEFRSSEIVKNFARWIIEASRLSAAGMPDGSFTLLFDAYHASDQASNFFELLKQEVAWQQAWDHWTTTKLTHCSVRMRRLDHCFLFEGLPQVVEDMIRGRSLIKCNFPIGELIDIAPFIDDIPEVQAWDRVGRWRQWGRD